MLANQDDQGLVADSALAKQYLEPKNWPKLQAYLVLKILVTCLQQITKSPTRKVNLETFTASQS